MSIPIQNAIRKAFNIFPRARMTGGATVEEILKFEALIKCSLPFDYRYFLEEYGTFGFYGLEIYGLIEDKIESEGPPNAYFMTKSDLEDGSIPLGCVVIKSLGYGPIYLLDCKNNGNVYAWNYTNEIDDELETFSSFSEFFVHYVDIYLSDYKNDQEFGKI